MSLKNIKLLNYGHLEDNNSTLRDITCFHQTIKKVMIQGINNSYLKKRIFHILGIDFFFQYSGPWNHKQINLIIKKLKRSGFFHKISLSYRLFYNEIHVIITLYKNPIIQSIKVKNIYQLKIIKDDLIDLLNNQVGYPKNFRVIDSIIQHINKWYFIRGYRWSSITYKQLNSKKTGLIINIEEGKIYKTEIICLNQNKYVNIEMNNQLIVNELHIQPGKLLNYNTIELGIIKLKKYNILSNHNYSIRKISPQRFKVTFYYHLPEKKQVFGFYEYLESTFNLLNLQYSCLIATIKNSSVSLLNRKLNKELISTSLQYIENSYLFVSQLLFHNIYQQNLFQLNQSVKKIDLHIRNSCLKLFCMSSVNSNSNTYLLLKYLSFDNKFNDYEVNNKTIHIVCNNSLFKYRKQVYDNLHNYITYQQIRVTYLTHMLTTTRLYQQFQLIQDQNFYHIMRTGLINQIYINNYENNLKNKFQVYYRQLVNYIISLKYSNTQIDLIHQISSFFKLQITTKQICKSERLSYKKLDFLIDSQLIISPINMIKKICGRLVRYLTIDAHTDLFSTSLKSNLKIRIFNQSINDSKYFVLDKLYSILEYQLEAYLYMFDKQSLFISIDFFDSLISFTNSYKNRYNVILSTGFFLDFNIQFIPKIKIHYQFHNQKLCTTFFFYNTYHKLWI